MKSSATYILTLLILIGTLAVNAQNSTLMGFSDEGSVQQIQLEEEFDGLLNATNLDQWMKYLSARPHHVGSPYDKKVVDFVASKFKEWGYQVKVEQFDVLFPTPRVRLLEMTEPTKYKASLTEPPVEGDASSTQTEEALPGYNCFSIDGDVTA